MPKKVNALDPRVREEECENHRFSFSGEIPLTGMQKCTICNTPRRVYICKTKPQINSKTLLQPISVRADDVICSICDLPRAILDPVLEGEVATEPFPDWACFEVFCGDLFPGEEE